MLKLQWFAGTTEELNRKIQAKRRKSLAKFLLPSEHVDAVIFRADNSPAMVLLTLWEYLDLLKEIDNAKK